MTPLAVSKTLTTDTWWCGNIHREEDPVWPVFVSHCALEFVSQSTFKHL